MLCFGGVSIRNIVWLCYVGVKGDENFDYYLIEPGWSLLLLEVNRGFLLIFILSWNVYIV